jgi:hypothetical protein
MVDPLDLDAARRRFCKHREIVDTDPLCISFPRGFVCLNCGAEVTDLEHYVVHEGTAVRTLRTERGRS